LVSLLKENPLYRIKITGHTDNVGSDADNIALSVARAKSVADALKARGIDNARITYEGKGESAPVTTNDTEEGRRQNRRTEYSLSKL
jgi:outer membrane protein OmpA-like peptidoglycan-associated protein